MDEKAVDICPINAMCIPIPQHSFAAEISAGVETSRFFDL
jgi:hypothetical protein